MLPETFVNPKPSERHSGVVVDFVGSHQTLKHLHKAQLVVTITPYFKESDSTFLFI